MRALRKTVFTISLVVNTAIFQCFAASAEPVRRIGVKHVQALSTSKQQGIWHESPVLSEAIDQLLIRNWESINKLSGDEWSEQIWDFALNLASKEASNYITSTVQEFPFVLNASINIDIRSQGTTNIGGEALFKLADFGLKEDNTRNGLAFLHTKYIGSLSNDSTYNTGLGFRHLIGDELLVGVNSYWDYRTTNYTSSYSRFGVGGEIFLNTLSLRNNWYISGTGRKNFSIQETDYYERVVPGWDLELGYRLPSNPNVAFFLRGFRWDYKERDDNTGIQGTVAYQITPHIRVDSWVSNEIPANPTLSNSSLDDREDFVFGLNFTLTGNKVTYKPHDTKQILQQEMVSPVRRRYDVLLERWAKATTTNSFTNNVGGS